MTQFMLGRDKSGAVSFSLPFSEDGYQSVLATTVAQSLTVPTKFDNAVAVFSFEPGTMVWVSNNETAELPTGSFTSTISQMNPTIRNVYGGDVLSFITNDTTAEVGVSFYAL